MSAEVLFHVYNHDGIIKGNPYRSPIPQPLTLLTPPEWGPNIFVVASDRIHIWDKAFCESQNTSSVGNSFIVCGLPENYGLIALLTLNPDGIFPFSQRNNFQQGGLYYNSFAATHKNTDFAIHLVGAQLPFGLIFPLDYHPDNPKDVIINTSGILASV